MSHVEVEVIFLNKLISEIFVTLLFVLFTQFMQLHLRLPPVIYTFLSQLEIASLPKL